MLTAGVDARWNNGRLDGGERENPPPPELLCEARLECDWDEDIPNARVRIGEDQSKDMRMEIWQTRFAPSNRWAEIVRGPSRLPINHLCFVYPYLLVSPRRAWAYCFALF
ncbi:hypothetical protein M513_02587, partial [Trichuris suis]